MNDDFESKSPKILELNNRMRLLIKDLNNILNTLLYSIEVLKKSNKQELQPSDLELLYTLQQQYLEKYNEVELLLEELKVLLVNENNDGDQVNKTPLDTATQLLGIYRRYLNLDSGDNLFNEN